MECTIAGRLLYDARKKKHISQKELCHGFCNQSTITRIENGEIMPSLKQMEFFFTRLGQSVPNNIVPISKIDKKRYDLENKMLSELLDSRDASRLLLLQEYKNCHHSWGKLEEQFYMMQQAVYVSQFDDKLQESIDILEKALQITNPEFSVNKNIPTTLFSIHEIIILNSIAHSEYCLYDLEKKDDNLKVRAIEIMRFLKEYFEEHFDNFKSWNMYSVIVFNLTNWIGLAGDVKGAMELAKLGLEGEKSSLFFFSSHLYNLGYSSAIVGEKAKSLKLLTQALNLKSLFDLHDDVKRDMQEIKDIFNIDISIN